MGYIRGVDECPKSGVCRHCVMEVGGDAWCEIILGSKVRPSPLYFSISSLFSLPVDLGANESRWTRKTFDYIILALFLIYAFAFCMFVFAKMRLNTWVLFLRIMWPCLICTDIMCFITGWIATWRDVSLG